jgi:hypothetical protein
LVRHRILNESSILRRASVDKSDLGHEGLDDGRFLLVAKENILFLKTFSKDEKESGLLW